MKLFERIFYYLLGFSILFYSCSSPDNDIENDDEIPNESSYLELDIDESLLSYNSDFWVIITNDNGEILTDSLITTGAKIEFIEHENEISDFLGIYFMRVFQESKHYRVEAMLGIEKNSSLSFKESWDHNNPEIGTVDVEITNFPYIHLGINLLATSNTQGFAHKDSEIIDSNPYDLVADTVRFKLSIVQENDTLLIGNSFKDNDPRYLRIEGVNIGDSYSFDFEEDFNPFENILTHEAPVSDRYSIMSFVYGYKNQSFFFTSMRFTSWSYRFTQFGYIDGFDSYKTIYAVMGYQGYEQVGFVKKGGPADTKELELPTYSVSITDTSFINFEYTFNRELAYRKAIWRSEDIQSYLYIYEDITNKCKQLSSLPIEISDRYDFIALDNLEFVECQFIENVEGYKYTDYFESLFSNYTEGEEFKYYSVTVK